MNNPKTLAQQPGRSMEKSTAEKVMDLFKVNAVVELPVVNYHQLPQEQKDYMCDLLKELTLCKLPLPNGGVCFYLGKEARV